MMATGTHRVHPFRSGGDAHTLVGALTGLFLLPRVIMDVCVSVASQLPVEAAVADGFGDVLGLEVLFAGEVGDGAGDAQDLVMGPGGQASGGSLG